MDLLMIIGLIVAGTFAWVYFHGNSSSDGGEGIDDRHNDNDSDSDSDGGDSSGD